MLSFFKHLFDGERPPVEAGDGFEERQLAAACLLVEAATMDGTLDAEERQTMLGLLQHRFQLDPSDAQELLNEAEERARESVEWHGFTRVIVDTFSDEERIQLIEMLWEVAYADGELHDYEASLLRRIAGLIYVGDRERGDAHARVRSRLNIK